MHQPKACQGQEEGFVWSLSGSRVEECADVVARAKYQGRADSATRLTELCAARRAIRNTPKQTEQRFFVVVESGWAGGKELLRLTG
jgi:hypothetical protein